MKSQQCSPESGNLKIKDKIDSDEILCAGKLGSSEYNFIISAMSGYVPHNVAELLHVNAGVYPFTEESFSKFYDVYLNAMSKLNIAAEWISSNQGGFVESFLLDQYCPDSTRVPLRSLEPFYHEEPWSQSLQDKKVLVISPFQDSIEKQYKKRKKVWGDQNILPDFDLLTMKIPFSAGVSEPEYSSWYEALCVFREQIENVKPDFVMVGAGAWSLPLVAYCFDLGIDSIHTGGGTQIIFGIKGGRWDKHDVISTFFNDNWCRPMKKEIPDRLNNMTIDKGHYW